MFGGNSNWRGPIWMPVNVLIIRALLTFYLYYGDDFKIECPTGSGNMMNLFQVAHEIANRLSSIFLRDESGRRPVYGGTEKFQTDPHWKDHILFYEYFHGDNGAGLGASHQTGWTGLVAKLLEIFGRMDEKEFLEIGKRDAAAVLAKGKKKELEAELPSSTQTSHFDSQGPGQEVIRVPRSCVFRDLSLTYGCQVPRVSRLSRPGGLPPLAKKSSGRCPTRRLQPAFHLIVIHQSRLLHHGPPAGKDREVRDAADLEARGQLRMAFGIDLHHHCLPGHVLRCFRNLRSCHATRAAPGCPEIRQHRDRRLPHNLVELGRVDVQRLIRGRQCDLHFPHVPVWERCFAGTRFLVLQLLQVRIMERGLSPFALRQALNWIVRIGKSRSAAVYRCEQPLGFDQRDLAGVGCRQRYLKSEGRIT